MDFPIFCPNADSLVERGAEFARDLPAGTVLALVGGLGMGKTHWTKGMLRGLGSNEVVTSPTFALLQEYAGGRLPVFHFDLYRLETEDEVLQLGWDDYLEEEGIVIAEWADLFPTIFPEGTIWLKITEEKEGRRIDRASGPFS
ncbi:tRNA (adenosine(37)-N6)-threonylcarbamoyltransferase complex ATPase subunit type 1 TsaE [Roseibacillus persicicus]|uniref:tRNA (adenosine(37)-N6)-threonylcarbamoyltransferase complex ATPase subunit type 1 TsaE n=1 Tax=Roseibacillus persicicus TaxID=454148 RepID=UPI00280EE923|nr:tRNA (adenosine(37)-N6)-threonylcarbamoyltransferase complex ATPase subunit type 1 TsaE [Roseibacillus persicicus]MDQ8190813.1 tRNA (adenosine(37)-N6)-threonylcarbamoyltransferase complex ATPase subunit type 1 TsaE [Roseibacillus persicicus]